MFKSGIWTGQASNMVILSLARLYCVTCDLCWIDQTGWNILLLFCLLSSRPIANLYICYSSSYRPFNQFSWIINFYVFPKHQTFPFKHQFYYYSCCHCAIWVIYLKDLLNGSSTFYKLHSFISCLIVFFGYAFIILISFHTVFCCSLKFKRFLKCHCFKFRIT